MLEYTEEAKERYRRVTHIIGEIVVWGHIVVWAGGFCLYLYGLYLWIFN